jgi:cytochrome c oxidase assembly factor CtaG
MERACVHDVHVPMDLSAGPGGFRFGAAACLVQSRQEGEGMKRTVFFGTTVAATVVAALVAPGRDAGAGNPFTLCLTTVSSVAPGELWSAWSFAPAVVIPLLALAIGYAAHARTRAPGQQHVMLFAGGFLLLAAAITSPLCRMAATLASAHMLQHMVLVALAPPLILLGFGRDLTTRPGGAISRLSHPGWTAVPYGLLIWFWHVPRFYEAALTDVTVHLLMYASLLSSAFLFWTSVIATLRTQPALRGWAMLALLATLVHTSLLGALLTFSRHLWFGIMAPGALTWGLTPLDDQQLAGIIMWVPMGIVYIGAALWALSLMLAQTHAPAAAQR